MAHRNARLTVHGRRLIVERVLSQGRTRAHVAAEMGVSRQCVSHWISRYLTEGEDGLRDRSSRPHSCPTRVPAQVEAKVLAVREQQRQGQDRIGAQLGLSARTVSRILRRHRVPYLRELDPLTGAVIRASKTTAVRYQRGRPGELVHMDVKKIGRIPAGGGWKAHGRAAQEQTRDRSTKTGRPHERVMTDNAWAYKYSLRGICAVLGARQVFIKPHCPWQNGKVERLNRTLQTEWAYRRPFSSNAERTAALAPWIEYYNTRRRHSALGGHPPTSRLS